MDPVEKNAAREFHIDPGRGRRGWRVMVAIAALVILVLIGLIAPRAAHANYFVKECTPSAQPYATDPYTISAGIYRISYSNECGTGSGYGLRLDAHGTSGPGGRLVWQVGAPGGTVFKTADVDVHYGNDDGYGPAMATAAGGYLPLNGGNGPNQWAHSSLSNTDHFGIWLMCWRTGQSCTSNWAYAWSTNVLVEVDDLVAPQITASGEILDGGTVHGVQAVQATRNRYRGRRPLHHGLCQWRDFESGRNLPAVRSWRKLRPCEALSLIPPVPGPCSWTRRTTRVGSTAQTTWQSAASTPEAISPRRVSGASWTSTTPAQPPALNRQHGSTQGPM